MTCYVVSFWDDFLWGFRNIIYIWDSYHYNDRLEFWEALSMGWVRMEDENLVSQPGFDASKIEDSRYGYYLYVLNNKVFNKKRK